MKKNNIYLAAAAALLALTACNKEFAPEAAGDITIDASIGAMTKVSYDGATTSFTAGDQIAVYAWMGSAAAVPDTRVVDGVRNTLGTDGKWTPATQMRWKTVTDAHYFLGVYPAKDITDFTADAYTLDPAAYTASDLLIATNLSGVKATDGTVALNFDHAMAKLNVNLKFRSQWDATPTVTSVTVTAKKTATVNYLTKAITATGGASEVDIPAAATATTGYALSFSGLQVPQSGVTTVTVTIAGKTYVYESATDIPLESGKYTTLGLIVGKDKLELGSISVTDWEAGTTLPDGDAVLFEPFDPLNTPLTFETLEAGAAVTFDIFNTSPNPVYYRTWDGTAWTDWATYTDNDPVTLAHVGDMLQFKGNNASYQGYNSKIKFDKDCYVFGNIMSLVAGDDFSSCFTLTDEATFAWLFSDNSHLLFHDSKRLLLPATKLTNDCYYGMFANCTGLTNIPEGFLPATTLAWECYGFMFKGCSGLLNLPIGLLLAGKDGIGALANNCYVNMFEGCSGLTVAPALPSETLAEGCYNEMFKNCISLMAAPVLPAPILVNYCYTSMFEGCTKLSSVTCLATNITGLYHWLYDAGTADGCERKVYVDPSMLSNPYWNLDTSGTDGKRWTLENADYANLTSADIGKMLGANGKIYADAAQATAAGTTAVAMIAYVGSETGSATYNHGLAIALADESDSYCAWSNNISEFAGVSTSMTMTDHKAFLNGITDTETLITKYGDGYAAKKAKNYQNTVASPIGTSGWFLPSSGQWLKFFEAAGVDVANWTSWGSSPDGASSYTKVHDLMETVATGSSVKDDWYWSSSEYYDYLAVFVFINSTDGVALLVGNKGGDHGHVRSFLAF